MSATAQFRVPRIGSLCSGYGGLEMGLQAVVGGSVAWHVEYDKHPSAVLAERFPGVPNYGDITTTDWSQVEPVDWLTAGYPCQPFSHAGKRKGKDDERHLWPFVAGAIGVLRPRRVLLENVRGHVSLGLADVLADLSGLGYDATWGVVRAADAGAPHSRARIFIVATNARRVGPEGRPSELRGGVASDEGSLGRPTGRAVWSGDVVDCSGPASDTSVGRPSGGADVCPRQSNVGWIGRRFVTDTDRTGSQGRPPVRQRADERAAGPRGVVDWGVYASAIRNWEHVTGRPAPRPTEPGRTGERLSPRFVEWMMGLPAGWVTDVLPRNPALKCLGNGVVPQQAALAVSVLCHNEAVAA